MKARDNTTYSGPKHSAEREKRLKEFHEEIGKALVANLNRNVMAKSGGDQQRKARMKNRSKNPK
jgi:hypothetical protein